MLFKDKYSRLEYAIYTIGWGLLFLLPLLVECYNSITKTGHAFAIVNVVNVWRFWTPIFALFLLNNFVLLPLLFFKKRRAWYLLALVAAFVVLWFVMMPPEPHAPRDHNAPPPPIVFFLIVNLIIELCVVLANFAIKVYVLSLRRDMVLLNIEKEKVTSELQSLKYQVSPHFLMNTLNNIQSLIDVDPQRAYQTIQCLSRMMRYLLYENNAATVSLQREVHFMSDFIEMMKIRYPEGVKVSAAFPNDCANIQVPPLLFISFLENAFKYGVSFVGDSFIDIAMEISGDHLVFRCANSKNARKQQQQQQGGIGLQNVRRRLQLLYGPKCQLQISDSEKQYSVMIDIPLSL